MRVVSVFSGNDYSPPVATFPFPRCGRVGHDRKHKMGDAMRVAMSDVTRDAHLSLSTKNRGGGAL